LELTGLECDEFGGGHRRLQWNHVSSFGEVEQQKGLNPVGYIICRMPESNLLCPEDDVMFSRVLTSETLIRGLHPSEMILSSLCFL
jgi:hypothetical protein